MDRRASSARSAHEAEFDDICAITDLLDSRDLPAGVRFLLLAILTKSQNIVLRK